MKRLVIVRHGAIRAEDRWLNEQGKGQMCAMGERLLNLPGGLGSVALLASPTARGFQSASLIGAVLGVRVKTQQELEVGDIAVERVLALVERHQDADTVILVGHDELVADFPRPFGQRVLGCDGFPRESIPRGTGWLIDCQAKTCTYLDLEP